MELLSTIIAVLGTILGVAIGFALGEWSRDRHEKRQAKLLLEALNDELEANRFMIPQKQDWIRRMIESLKKGKLMLGRSVAPMTVIYDNHYPAIAKKLSPQERDSVHFIYHSLKSCDEIMTQFEQTFKEDLGANILNNPFEAHIIILEGAHERYEVANRRIKAHLWGEPRDALYRHSGQKEPPRTFPGGLIPPEAIE